jgi:hypothetical protein
VLATPSGVAFFVGLLMAVAGEVMKSAMGRCCENDIVVKKYGITKTVSSHFPYV